MPEEIEVKVGNPAPGNMITGTAFGNEAMDTRIPFEVAAKRVKNADKAGSKELSHIDFVKHTENNALYS